MHALIVDSVINPTIGIFKFRYSLIQELDTGRISLQAFLREHFILFIYFFLTCVTSHQLILHIHFVSY